MPVFPSELRGLFGGELYQFTNQTGLLLYVTFVYGSVRFECSVFVFGSSIVHEDWKL